MTGLINRIKRITAIGLIAVLMSQSVPMTAYGAGPDNGDPAGNPQTMTDVTYLDETGMEQTCSSYTILLGNETLLEPGWYVVSENIVFNSSLILNGAGEYHIILSDGSTMTIAGEYDNTTGTWIAYNNSNSPVTLGCLYDDDTQNGIKLSIYGQAAGSGKLNIYNNSESAENRTAKVGDAINVGELTINGGMISCTAGGANSYGINTDKFTINDGTLTATATADNGNAIYCDNNNSCFTVNGGSVTSVAKANGGSGIKASSVTINGGEVYAEAKGSETDDNNFGIMSGGIIRINGGQVTAKGTHAGIYSQYNGDDGSALLLSWKKETDFVSANSILLNSNQNVAIEPGKTFIDVDGHCYDAANVSGVKNLTDFTLRACDMPQVTFDSNGGTAVEPQTVDSDLHATRPATPIKQGYTFNGWYRNSDLSGEAFDFSTETVNTDLTLYAKWAQVAEISYICADEEEISGFKTYIPLEADYTALPAGNYYVGKDISLQGRIEVTGEVNLILGDGYTLTVPWGISVMGDNTLNIFCQSEGTGRLIANAASENAAIGGDSTGDSLNGSSGNINIYGGNIQAQGADYAAAIGGGKNNENYGTIRIFGGTVSALSGECGAAIGGGQINSSYYTTRSTDGTIGIYGGKVTVSATEEGTGIGGGKYSYGGDISILGGQVTVTVSPNNAPNDPYSGIGDGYLYKGPEKARITLGCGNADDFIYAEQYYGNVRVAPYQTLQIADDDSTKFYGEISDPNGMIRKKTLKLSHTHELTFSVNGSTITASCSDSGCELHNNPAVLTLHAPSENDIVYDSNEWPAIVTDDQGISGYAPVYYQKQDENPVIAAPKDVGTYQASITLSDGKTHSTATVSVEYTIIKREVTISGLTADDKVYDDSTAAKINDTSIKLENMADGDDVHIVSGNASFDSADAGTDKTVTFTGYSLSGEAAGNYELLSQPASVNADIEKRPVTIKANDQSVQMGDAIDEMDVTLDQGTDKGILTERGHELVLTLTPDPDPRSVVSIPPIYPGSDPNAVPVPGTTTGTITPSGAVIKRGEADVTGNYDITYQNGSLEITWRKAKITKSPTAGVNLKYQGFEKEQWLLAYPGEADTKMEYKVQQISRGNGELLKNPDGSLVRDNKPPTDSYGDAFSAWEAGTYHVWYRAAMMPDDVMPSEPGCITVSIDTVPLTIRVPDASISYGDEFPALTPIVNGFVTPEEHQHIGTVRLEYQINDEWKNVEDSAVQGTCPAPGTYPVRISYTGNGEVTSCYDITYIPGTLTVEPRTVGLTWGNTQFTYDGNPHVPTVTLSNLANNEASDAVTVNVTGEQVNAGQNYTATAVSLSGSNAGKYRLPSDNTITKTFSIAKKNYTESITNVGVSVPVSATSFTASVAGKMPADAGALTYSLDSITSDGFDMAAGDFTANVDETGLVTVTRKTQTLPQENTKLSVNVKVNSTNYNEKTIKLKATFISKADAGVSIGSGSSQSVKSLSVNYFDYKDTELSLNAEVVNPGTEGTLTWESSNPEVAEVGSNSEGNCSISIKSVGTSRISVKYDSATTSGYASLLLSVNLVSVEIPQAITGLSYDGTQLTGVVENNTYYTVTGGSGTDPGDYVATVTLKNTAQYRWTDGTKVVKYIPWKIEKAAGPGAPTGLQGVAPTTADNIDGKITGVSDSMEYSTNNNFGQAIRCMGTDILGLTPGTYYVRVRETATTKAGAATIVSVESCSAPSVRAIQGLVYNGSSQILVETDAASNGKIYYAVARKGDPEPAEGQYSTSTATAKYAGSYYVWYKASRNDKASYVEVTIRKKNATVMLSAEDKTYDGTTDATLTITVDGVCAGDSILITGVSGKFADKNVGGNKNVSADSSGKIITGAENYVLSDIPGSTQASISKRDLSEKNGDVVIRAIPVQYYTGSEICPKPVVKCLGMTLEEGVDKDYTLSYKNNTGKGTASVTVTGNNNCVGTLTRNFEIGLPAFGTVTVVQPVDKDFGTALGTAPAVTAKDASNQDIDLTGETVTVYFSSSSAGTGTEWDPMANLNAGTYYVWATVAEKTGDHGHSAARSELVSFKVNKVPYDAPDAVVLPAQQEAGYDVTVALPIGAKNTDYEYVITDSTANEPATDSRDWSVLPVLTDGKFTAAGLNTNTGYKFWLRRKADANHTASTAISRTFATPEKVMLSYDLNGGSGTVPEPKSYASGTFVAIDDGAKVSRYGYSFDGWWDAKVGGTKAEGNLQITESRVLYAHWLANQYFVSYDANEGRGTMADQLFIYDSNGIQLRENNFSRSGYIFAGWATSAGGEVVYTDRQNVKNLASKGTVTLYAVWVDESRSVSGEVKEGEDEANSTPAQGIIVTLKRGDKEFGGTQTTGIDGRYSFSGVPAGIYNLVATRNLGNVKTQTVTQLIEVTTGNVDVGSIVMPDENVSSEIDVKADTPVVMVGGLDAVAAENAEDGKEVNVTMTVEKKSEAQAEGSEEIRQLAEESSEDGSKVEIDFLDISIGKTVGEQTIAEPVTETGNVVELIIPFNFTGKRNCQMLRFHEGEAMAFRKLASRPQNPEDGTCFEDYENSRLFAYSKLFSTFAISYESSSGYMITFRKNDGTGDQYIQDITADAATSVTLTANTFNRSGYSFSGWNTEANGEGTSYTDGQSMTLTSDLVLYAQWTQNSGGGGGGGTTPVPATYTVSFNMNGKETANAPEMQQVEEGKCAIEPVDTPTAEGFKFDGWYMEAECVNTFDFNSPITADTVVYAKWIEEEAETFTVAFDLNGKTGTAPAEQTVEKDKTATEPAAPSSEGYTFTGWYTKADCKTKYDFATPVTTDITLYAGWEAKSEPEPIIIVDDGNWNLYEDDSVHEFKIRGISVDGTVANSNVKSKAYYDAKISGSAITVSVTGDRKKAAEAANATLEFDLGSSGVVEYTLPVSYVKPSFKLSSTTATIKSGSETVLKTTLLVKNSDGSFEPYDMTGVKVSGTGLGTVTKTEDGNIEIRTSKACKGQISIVKDAWDGATPVSLNYTVKGSKKDVLYVDLQGLKTVVVNSNAKGQVFRYDITLNGAAPEEGDIQIVDKKNTGLTIVSDGKLVISYKDGVKNGTYTITLQAGEAKTNVKVKVSGKALDKAITAKIQTKYDVVTKQAMVVVPKLKDVSGTIEAVTVAESGFSAKLNAAGNIVIDYVGDTYNVKNLNIGTLTLSIKLSGIDEPVKLTLNKVKAKKTTPKVKVGIVTIPAGTVAADGKIIATANIVSTYKVSSGKYMTIRPIIAEIVGTPKNVSAKVNENDVTEIDIYSISKKNASFKVKLTYAGGVTKTVTVKVKK